MKYLFVFITAVLISCTKGEKALTSGIWTLDEVTLGSIKVEDGVTKVNFDDDGKLRVKNHEVDYVATDKTITINGQTYSYSASRKKLTLGFGIMVNDNDLIANGSSELSK